ncbi:MAG: hypothetical protein ACYCT7_04290 [bacterium]
MSSPHYLTIILSILIIIGIITLIVIGFRIIIAIALAILICIVVIKIYLYYVPHNHRVNQTIKTVVGKIPKVTVHINKK